ncbi:hypothetical protein D9756_001823 [Leucocoprinus leucothites]|uniref:Metallo-beta-lactamase domain-containing protein n=1 Tax=Leucocoprinus leucothites TaxID=201217 RepID=A0A8H5G3Y4_9AGAR|nr:hypothetical protein D9756_001823 [Leucoagaricus leucothites]
MPPSPFGANILRSRFNSSYRPLIRSIHSFASRKPILIDTSERMVYPMSVTFLGTSSGGGPTQNRNCSSLVCDFFEGNNLWMVDCAEGTTRQFVLQPQRSNVPRVRISQITKLFVTHMHADHIMGIPTLLRNILRAPRIDAPPPPSNAIENRKAPAIHIYGPCGLRSFIRQNLKMTFTRSDDTYVVHELLKSDDPITPCNPPPDEHDQDSGSSYKDWDILHCSETPGNDILADTQGLWCDIASHIYSRRATQFSVHAGPILHREPCIGYVFDETTSPRRKVVVLGDTYDPSSIIPLCENPSPTLLIHEATDSTISAANDLHGKLSKRSIEDVMKTTLARGHSTPMMAGEFAKRVNAQKLVLNHIGSRFPAPTVGDNRRGFTHNLLDDLEEKATRAWDPSSGDQAIVALDFMRVLVPEPRLIKEISTPDTMEVSATSSVSVSTSYLPPSLPQKPPPQTNTFVSARQPVGTGNFPQHNNMQPPTTWNNQNGPLAVNPGFQQSVPLGNIPSPTLPFQATGQPGYYGPLPGFDPIQQAQSFLAFAQMQQMMQMAAAAGANAVHGTGIGMSMGMGIGMGVGIEMEMGMPGVVGPYGLTPMGGGMPIPMPVDAAIATVTALAEALEAPRDQPRVDATGDLEGLERDPVIARSMAAANIKYENDSSSEHAENQRKLEGNQE